MHAKFEVSISYGSKVIAKVKVENRQTDRQSKIETVPRGIRGEKSSKDMASSRNLVSTIGALANPEMGDGTRCPEKNKQTNK